MASSKPCDGSRVRASTYRRTAVTFVRSATVQGTAVVQCTNSASGTPSPRFVALSRVWWRLAPWPDAVAGLLRLKRRYILSPLFNASFIGMVELARFAGLPWDCIITAENAHCYKPRPEVYRTAISLLGLRPDEVMMVAAHNYDLAAARREGMATAFVPRPSEFGPGQKTDLEPESPWDVVAKNFEDLAARLGC